MFDVRGSGKGWFVLKAGQIIGKGYAHAYQAHALADRLARAAKVKRRQCLCCAETFLSEGPHNRWCDPCRAQPDAAMI